MAVVDVDLDVVTEQVTEMKRGIEQQRQDLDSIAGKIGFIDSAWEDQAQQAYANNFQGTKTRIENFNQALEAYIDKFQEFVNKVNEDDQARGKDLENITW